MIQADLRKRLPGLSINMGGATSIDITREGVDKAYGLKKLRDASGIELDAMMFIGDAIFPGGNDYPAKELGLDTVRVRDPEETLSRSSPRSLRARNDTDGRDGAGHASQSLVNLLALIVLRNADRLRDQAAGSGMMMDG